jgi:hypothetical protein
MPVRYRSTPAESLAVPGEFLGGLTGAFWPTIIGAVAGSVVAGTIAYILQSANNRQARNERLAGKRQEDLVLAFTTMVKVIKIMSHLTQIKDTLDECLAIMPPNIGIMAWTFVRPFAAMPPKVTFTKEESGFILSTHINALMLTALEIADVHNDTIVLMDKYSKRREELAELTPIESLHGDYAVTKSDPETMKALLPRVIPTNAILSALIERRSENHKQAVDVYTALKSHCEKRFGKDFPPIEMKPVENSPRPKPPTALQTAFGYTLTLGKYSVN